MSHPPPPPPVSISPTLLGPLWGHSGLSNSYQCFQEVSIHVSHQVANKAKSPIPLCWRQFVALTWYLIGTPKVSANLKMSYFPGAFLVSFRNRPLAAKSHLSSRYTQKCLSFLWIHSSAPSCYLSLLFQMISLNTKPLIRTTTFFLAQFL